MGRAMKRTLTSSDIAASPIHPIWLSVRLLSMRLPVIWQIMYTGDRDAWRAQPAHRHVVDAHAPYVVVRTFVLSHALQQRVVSRFAAHAARCAHAQVLLRNRRLHGRLVELSRCNDVLAHVAERRTTSSLLPLTETVPMPL